MKRKIFLENTDLEIAKIKRCKIGFEIVMKNLAKKDMSIFDADYLFIRCIDHTEKYINEGKVIIYTTKIKWEVCGDIERIYFYDAAY